MTPKYKSIIHRSFGYMPMSLSEPIEEDINWIENWLIPILNKLLTIPH